MKPNNTPQQSNKASTSDPSCHNTGCPFLRPYHGTIISRRSEQETQLSKPKGLAVAAYYHEVEPGSWPWDLSVHAGKLPLNQSFMASSKRVQFGSFLRMGMCAGVIFQDYIYMLRSSTVTIAGKPQGPGSSMGAIIWAKMQSLTMRDPTSILHNCLSLPHILFPT